MFDDQNRINEKYIPLENEHWLNNFWDFDKYGLSELDALYWWGVLQAACILTYPNAIHTSNGNGLV